MNTRNSSNVEQLAFGCNRCTKYFSASQKVGSDGSSPSPNPERYIGDISGFSDDRLTNLLLYGDNVHSIEVNTSILKNTLTYLKSSERFDVPLL